MNKNPTPSSKGCNDDNTPTKASLTMPIIADNNGGGFIDPRTLQLIALNRACELHLKGIGVNRRLTKIGKRLGFSHRTVKRLKQAVQEELDFIKSNQGGDNE